MRLLLVPLVSFSVAIAVPAVSAQAAPAAYIAAAVADAGRPAEDTARDAARKPAEMLAFAKVKPGDTVLELLPGKGYFTRILSKTVGPKGHVYAVAPGGPMGAGAAAIAANPAYANVSVIGLEPAATQALPTLDMVFTAQNYHDTHLSRLKLDVPALDKLWLSKLKPGGVLLVIDHAALPGAPVTETADKLHRIDPAAAKAEITAAGFVYDGKLDVLRNPADPRNILVFDPSIRGKTDQFVFRFKKPG